MSLRITAGFLVVFILLLLGYALLQSECANKELAKQLIYGHKDTVNQIRTIEIRRYKWRSDKSRQSMTIDDPSVIESIFIEPNGTGVTSSSSWTNPIRIDSYRLYVLMEDGLKIRLFVYNDSDLYGNIVIDCRDRDLYSFFESGALKIQELMDQHELQMN